jgi:hypothetical protein
MEIAGPARGHALVRTKYSPDGTRTRGTLNNCAHGVTPWNTYLTAEENWAGYFRNLDQRDGRPALPREHARYGVPTSQARYNWDQVPGGADEFVRFNASSTGADATQDYRNEPNAFGWIVEIDPFNPNAMPVKRTGLGRFAHEGVVFGPAREGRPVVAYSGDDSTFEYVYKSVSARPFNRATANGALLDDGILYVAKDLPAPGREGVAMEALDELAELIEAAGGRTLALFSSWRGVDRAAEYLRVRLDAGRFPLLVQKKGDSVGSLVQRFADDHPSTLLGTVSLWQGVDVPGESCIQVVIDRIPFPRPDDPLLSARQRAVDEAGGSGFRSISVPKAGLLLAQGAGRLIRGTGDRGVVSVLDSRLATAGYGRALRASLPPFWYTTDRATVLTSLTRLRDELDSAD